MWVEFHAHTFARSVRITGCYWWGMDPLVMLLSGLRKSPSGLSRIHGDRIGERMAITKSAGVAISVV